MDDILMLALVVALFLATWGLTAFCERLSGRRRT
jgi:hypothetical protein